MSKIESGTIPEGRQRGEKKLFEVWVTPARDHGNPRYPEPYFAGDAETLADAEALRDKELSGGWCSAAIYANVEMAEDMRRQLHDIEQDGYDRNLADG